MIKDFELKGRLLFSNRIFGLGFHFQFKPAFATFETNWFLIIDLIWIRFWIESIKKNY